jgi:sugar (pentulose or hexulose) kinase
VTLGTSREDILAAMIDGLARASAERLELLRSVGRMGRNVLVSGGSGVLGRGVAAGLAGEVEAAA